MSNVATQKAILIVLLFICFQTGNAQSEKIKRVSFSDVEYLLYPENHRLTEWNNSPPYWREKIIRKEYKLEEDEKTDGRWIQFYEGDKGVPAKIFSLLNGKVKCSGKYKFGEKNIETNCEGGADLNCGELTNNWKAFDEKGKASSIKILISKGLIEDRELSLDRLFKIKY